MKKTKALLPVAVALVLLGAGCTKTTTTNTNTAASFTRVCATETAECLSYAGQDGKSALELLESGHQVEATDQGFVNAIDGVRPGDRQFWGFYANGKQAEVGAKEYITNSSETIEWKLETY